MDLTLFFGSHVYIVQVYSFTYSNAHPLTHAHTHACKRNEHHELSTTLRSNRDSIQEFSNAVLFLFFLSFLFHSINPFNTQNRFKVIFFACLEEFRYLIERWYNNKLHYNNNNIHTTVFNSCAIVSMNANPNVRHCLFILLVYLHVVCMYEWYNVSFEIPMPTGRV